MTAIATSSHTLAGFNGLPAAEAERELGACCAVPDWTRTVAAGRPYRDVGSLVAAADAALRGLTWEAVAQALAAHPKIGERAAGTDREARWSRWEQAGMAAADAPTRAALVRANQDYERRFGHIFLVDAAGRGDAELLAAARDRLGNDETAERAVVHEQLRRIALRRLRRLVTGYAPLSTHVLDTVRGEPARDVPVELERWDDGTWSPVAAGRTDADGRLRDWVPTTGWRAARYRLVFAVERYLGGAAFFPEIAVAFQVGDPARPHHVPLLLSPYGYTTYRGS